MATDTELDKENPDFDRIRHFKADWKDFTDFWEKKGARMTPWEEWDQEHPKKQKGMKSNKIHSFKTFDDESKVEESGEELATIDVDKLAKKYDHLQVGDNVIDKTRQTLGVGTINSFSKDGKKATVQFYDTLQGSTMNMPGDEYEVDKEKLMAIAATDDSYQFQTFEQYKQSLDEDNLTALAGSSMDMPPMPKPFVVKTKKKRKGSNQDEDDETQEVANMNTTSIGTR
jgi:hypothetical protein